MLVRPELQALRVDDRPQRAIQHRLVAQAEAWRSLGAGAGLADELSRFAAGAPLAGLPRLGALFAPAGDAADAADDLASAVVEWLVAELAAAPLGQVPLRHQCDRTCATLVLAHCPTATLVLQAVDGAGLARHPAARSASFTATETWERVLAGRASALRVTAAQQGRDRAALVSQTVALRAGDMAFRSGKTEARLLTAVPGVLVTLKLQRSDGSGAPSREYALDDGRLLHQAAGSPRDSRLELTAALLGRMERADAAPLLAALAVERGSPQLRWQVLRECLALDSGAGFAALAALAGRGDDPLAQPAQALRQQLLHTYPQLAGVEPCPA